MMICSACKKNIAVIFTNKTIEGKHEMSGLCLPCAKKMGLAPLDSMLQNSGLSEAELENLNQQMSSIMEDIDIEKLDKDNPYQSILNSLSSQEPQNTNEDDFSNVFSIENDDSNKSQSKGREKKQKAKRKHLDSFGINLTEKALAKKIDKVIGRNREIDRVIQILNRRTKNNPVLIGEAGVGKTAIAEGLAVRIAEKQVPLKLQGTQVYLLELTSIVAGTQFRGQFESRMKAIIEEAMEWGNVVLIIDEIHNIIGAGNADSGAMNAANILKPALSKGELQVIGATTLDEYRKYIEKDAALERRFQPVLVEEPSTEEAIQILKGIRSYYEEYHKVIIPDEVIEYAVKLSERYVSDRYLPDKAIDVIDEAGSRANLKNQGLVELEALKEELMKIQVLEKEASVEGDYARAAEYKVSECKIEDKINAFNENYKEVVLSMEDVATVVESWTKIPVQKITEIEAEKLLNLEERLHRRVIGQEQAVVSLAKTIRRNRSGFKKQKKPTSFIFVGPTGVGKTELVRTISEELFGSEKSLIRMDMSEYMEKHTVSKLIGAPPGYVGFDQGGQLTEKVRRHPYSVILLDEIEKAHPDVFNMLLQILEDGRLTDSQGRTVHFENTIIIMTSNAGTNQKGTGIGFSSDSYKNIESNVQNALKEVFRPEFLNRVDETIIFTELSKLELREIVDLMLKEIFQEAKEKDISLAVSEEVKDFILTKGYNPKFGARPLRRTIQKLIEDELAELYLKGTVKEGARVEVILDDDKIKFI